MNWFDPVSLIIDWEFQISLIQIETRQSKVCKTLKLDLNHCAILALLEFLGLLALLVLSGQHLIWPVLVLHRFYAFCKSEQCEFKAICLWKVVRESFAIYMTSTFWCCWCWGWCGGCWCWCWWCRGWGWLSRRGRGQCQRMGTKPRVATLPSLRPRNAPTSNRLYSL